MTFLVPLHPVAPAFVFKNTAEGPVLSSPIEEATDGKAIPVLELFG